MLGNEPSDREWQSVTKTLKKETNCELEQLTITVSWFIRPPSLLLNGASTSRRISGKPGLATGVTVLFSTLWFGVYAVWEPWTQRVRVVRSRKTIDTQFTCQSSSGVLNSPSIKHRFAFTTAVPGTSTRPHKWEVSVDILIFPSLAGLSFSLRLLAL